MDFDNIKFVDNNNEVTEKKVCISNFFLKH